MINLIFRVSGIIMPEALNLIVSYSVPALSLHFAQPQLSLKMPEVSEQSPFLNEGAPLPPLGLGIAVNPPLRLLDSSLVSSEI